MQRPRSAIRDARTLLLSAGLALALAAAPPAIAATTVVKVTSNDLAGGHWHVADTRLPGTGIFENGPEAPPYGIGSFELRTPENAAKVQLLTDLHDRAALADMQGIGYWTYRDASSTGFVAGVSAINMRIDLQGDGTADAYMVYEPYQDLGTAAVSTGVWQEWDAYRGGAARWWINTGAGGCGQSTPCTWSTIVATFPQAQIREAASCGPGGVTTPCPGSFGVNQGSFNTGIVSSADGLYIQVGGDTTVYDFDMPIGPPASKDDCKDGGWSRFDNPRFRNQGACVSFVHASGRD